MNRPNRNRIYDGVIRRMVSESLAQKEAQFAAEHAGDSNEQLLLYLQGQAQALGHTPRKKEIIGWSLIKERFGTWNEAVSRAGLAQISTLGSPEKYQLYQDEIKIQKKLYRAIRVEKKAKLSQRRRKAVP